MKVKQEIKGSEGIYVAVGGGIDDGWMGGGGCEDR